MLYDTPRRRRLLMPLAILLIGGGIALWGTQRQAKQSEEVRQMVLSLCRDVVAGHDVSQRLQALSSTQSSLLIRALTDACSAARDEKDIVVNVTPGDLEDGSAFAGAATHIAVIQIDGISSLGLRMRHNGDGKPIEILGHFTPAPDA
jgi:hypothetical protein